AALQYKGQWQPDDAPARFNQRSIYMFVKRNIQNPLLENFDAPGTLVPCGQRSQSSHAGQALMLLNSPLLARQSELFASRLRSQVGTEPVTLVTHAYRLALGRRPRSQELQLASMFLQGDDGELMDKLSDFCLTVFNLDEFLYIE
ncbi:MAG: DUF1553 domain-containing protein, partial [Planctomycetaceae bacterium]